MADGSIRVNTKLDTKPAEADLKKLEKECEKTAREIERVGGKVKTAFTGGNGIQKLGQDCDQTAAKIGEVGKTAQAVFTGMSKSQLNSAFKTANKELIKTEEKLAAVDAKIAEIQAETDTMLPQAMTGEQTSNLLAIEETQTAPLNAERDKLIAQATEYKSQLERITAELEKQTQEEATQNALKTTGKQAAADAEWISKINSQKQYDTALSSTKAKMAAIEQQAARISQETGRPVSKLLQQDAEYQKLSRRLSLLTSQTREFGTAGKSAAKKTKNEMSRASKTVQNFNNSLKKGIKKIGKMALAVFGIRAAYMAVRRAANAYLESNQELSNQMTSLWNIAGQAIGPVVEMLVKGVSTAVIWINSLVKALTGVDLVARANAAALKKQASATGAAAKAARQLAGFDEINKLNDNNSAGGGGGAATGTFDPAMAFDIPSWMEKIKQQIIADDWYGAGETLAKSLMDGIKNTNWKKMGKDLGAILTDTLDFAFGFILNWDSSVVTNAALDFLTGLFDEMSDWLQNKNWAKIGYQFVETIWNSIANVDMNEFVPSAAEFIGSLLGAMASFNFGTMEKTKEIAKKIWKSIKDHFSKYVDWGGTPGEIIEGLWEGIKDALKNAGDWIHDNIWVPFRDGFKKAFGIASPSKKMKEFGGYLIDGLKNGIGNIWKKVKDKFTEWKTNISNWFKDRKTDFKNWGSGLIEKFTSGIGNIWSKIKEKFANAKASIGEWASSLKEKGKNAGGKFIDGLKNGFNTLKTKLKEPINALIGMIEKALNWIIDKMNKLSWKIPDWVPGIGGNKFGFNVSKVSIPRLAKGGIVNNPGKGVLATIGEAGKEAVLPLENNTEWMDLLAERINAVSQKIVVPIYLNGRKIAEEVIDLTKRRNFAMNGGTI